jgi:guanosine-3',5'-bis(diphosphate) 3'-pyrophosphohydrolase
MIRFNDILEKIASRFSDKDIAVLQKAYVFSAKAHKGQVRRSGEPYLSHPLEVTNFLADMNMDRTTLVAGLLHDVLEDTDVTISGLKEAFGRDVASLVESVTKISRVQEASPETRRAETIRKIILAMTTDLRVIFIKLADRLHNLQTLKFLSEDKQRQIASETLEIYAPIATRLGMGRIKAELEDLAFRYVDPEEYFRIASLVEPRRKKAEADLRRLKINLSRLMKDNGIPAEIYFRIKRPYSIYRKMKSQRIDFGQVFDFLALRIITDTVKNCYAALGIIHQNWPPLPQRFRDFIAMPKPNLYQALHTTIITEDKQRVEIQIRTREMHTLAENGIAAHWKYKDEDPQELLREDQRLRWLREMVELFREQKNPKEFLKNLKINLIPDEVYVFTPKGRVVALPSGSSALDFAFRIHTEIGLHSAHARINGKAAPLKTRLKTGDIVEIMTAPDKVPSRSWLNIAFTSGARHQIKRWLNLREKAKGIALGKKLWERETRRFGWPPAAFQPEAMVQRLRRTFGLQIATLDDLHALVGLGKIVVNRKFLERLAPEFMAPPLKGARPPRTDIEIPVKDRNEELIRLAKCCSPIKGEPIIGYISSGKGITAHALRCPRIARETLSPERMVEITWGEVGQDHFKAGLNICSSDAPGLLAEVATTISAQGGNITKAEVRTFADKKAQIKLGFVVKDITHLEGIIKKIAALDGIQSVERL